MKQRPKLRYLNANGHDFYNKSDDEDEIIEFTRVAPKVHHVEVDVQEGDTLQAIALRFNCSVATLKKVNNIHRENEIFAKGKLKIPVAAFSLLTENIPSVHTSGNSSPTKPSTSTAPKVDPLDSDVALQQKLIIASVNSAELSRVSSEVPLNDPPSEEYDVGSSLLPNPSSTSIEDVVLRDFTAKGADFGIKSCHLVIFALCLVFVIPLVYVLYIAEHPEKYLHQE